MPTTPELLSVLVEAFPPRPLDPAIFAGPGASWDSYIKDKAFEADSQGRLWNVLGSDFAEAHWAALGFMSLDGFAAIIPTYLAALVRGDTEGQVSALVFSQLTRKEDRREEFDARAARMTAHQRAIIARVLEAIASNEQWSFYEEQIRAALESWRAVSSAT